MEKCRLPRIMIAGTQSGCGKTTVTCALLSALKAQGQQVVAFKCGPDYIDPMFHSRVVGVPSRNLDLFLCGEQAVKSLLAKNGQDASLALMEGVMGFYDGLSGDRTEASSHHLSEITETPVILVANCKGKSLSLAAELKGFLEFLPNRIAGVILNGATPMSYPMYRRIIEEQAGLKPLGYLPPIPEAAFESRHLGLVTAGEVSSLQQKVQLLGEKAAESMDLDGILELSGTAAPLSYEPMTISPAGSCRIGVALDHAFCFYYRDNLDLLEELGAKIVFFSPLTDRSLPENLDGLIFGGGYPELHAPKLSANQPFLDSLRAAAKREVPIYAECGGFLYLQEALSPSESRSYPMAGLLSGEGRMTDKLTRFGYLTLKAQVKNLLCEKGETINAHEFHYSDSTHNGGIFLAKKPSGKSWGCFQKKGSILAGYPHLHFYGNPDFARNLVKACDGYRQKREKTERKGG